MRTIVHLSDLHFGRVDPHVLEPLISTVNDLKPNLVAVSGDLTQRARSRQFLEARAFLDKLPQPQIVVPGNHDVPLHNLFARFVRRLTKYKRYITEDLQPVYADEELVVIGVNTARSLTFKSGRINELQVAQLRNELCARGDNVIKIVVTHHPFDLPAGHDESDLLGRAVMAMTTLADCGADLFLSGHLHLSHTGHTAKRYKIAGHSALVVQAGTATSTRGRGEANSFNLVRINSPKIRVERFVWQPSHEAFMAAGDENFERGTDGWIRI
ncbi:MAG: metallophosphoesterase [Pyrinomonadaceae bacterium]